MSKDIWIKCVNKSGWVYFFIICEFPTVYNCPARSVPSNFNLDHLRSCLQIFEMTRTFFHSWSCIMKQRTIGIFEYIYRKSPSRSHAVYIQAWLENGFISHGFYSEMSFHIKALSGFIMQYSIFPSTCIFNYKPWLVNKGGLSMIVAYPVSFFLTNISLAQTWAARPLVGDLW